jgi:(Z)-2-((N-methylformamido)methylene)-5-hydroxybutyrolactone dehydrogenase
VEVQSYKMLIGGEWVDARSGATFESINPYTAQPWATVPRAGAEDVDAAVRAARGAFETWSRTTPVARGKLMRRLADLIASNAERIAVVETTDNGKLIR